MHSFERQPAGASRGGGGVDELDQMLRGFFRSEMPQPWPAFKRPGKREALPATIRPSRWVATRSHLALAATVALLVLGSLCFSGGIPGMTGASETGGKFDPTGGISSKGYIDGVIDEARDREKSQPKAEVEIILEGGNTRFEATVTESPKKK